MIEIIPAILPKDLDDLTAKLELVKGLVDTVQVDVCDGKFVPNRTWPFTEKGRNWIKGRRGETEGRGERGQREKSLLRYKEVDFEAHLMVADPRALIPSFRKMGFSRILVHVESFEKGAKGETGGKGSEDFSDFIHEWRGSVEIGAVLKIETPLEAVSSFAHELSTLQLMGIAHIGKQGEPVDTRVIGRVREAHAKYPTLTIAVDGGVSLGNARELLAVGASRLVVGSAIFGAPDAKTAIAQFKSLV